MTTMMMKDAQRYIGPVKEWGTDEPQDFQELSLLIWIYLTKYM